METAVATERFRVLLVEDNPGDVRLLQETLRDARGGGFEIVHLGRLEDAVARMAAERFDVVLLDLGLPDGQGLDTYTRAQRGARGAPIVVLSGLDDEATALQAVQAGAQDYLVKGQVDSAGVVRAIRYAIERVRRDGVEAMRRNQTAHLWLSLFRTLGSGASAILYRAGLDAGLTTHAYVESTWKPRDGADFLRALQDYFLSTGLCTLVNIEVNRKAMRVTAQVEDNFESALHEGKSDGPLCHFLRGILCGIASKLLGMSEIVCDEVRCQAQGSERCEFLIHPLFT